MSMSGTRVCPATTVLGGNLLVCHRRDLHVDGHRYRKPDPDRALRPPSDPAALAEWLLA